LTVLLRQRSVFSRRRQRGAAFVEALIIVCSFVLFTIGLVFFFNLYTKKLRVARLARASAMAYAMGGCQANSPTDWVKVDLPSGSTSSPGQENNKQSTRESRGVQGGTEGGDKAKSIVSSLPGTGDDNNILNPVGSVGMSMSVTTESKPSPLAAGTGFTQVARSTSHVTCNDKVRDGDFNEIVGYVTDLFK